ncbi:MAG: bifunctional hydroxymethylpyrimidine kinase/phosphomethylpyrimidine kinase, partial [Nitratireductor sp.]|nr:bifunctional hydroxymethylpyrimidine kinase/phosphomethylpyrimidine kinase [Nitratireductor sp.]
SSTADDLLVSSEGEEWFSADRIETKNTHGTGCSLSSAIAANLARGMDLAEAVGAAKEWLTAAIAASDQLDVGEGSGPIHHFHAMWPKE